MWLHCSLVRVLSSVGRRHYVEEDEQLFWQSSKVYLFSMSLGDICEQGTIENDVCEIPKCSLTSFVTSCLQCYKQPAVANLTPADIDDPDSGWVNSLTASH
jgi:hypothetical protein